MKKNFFRKLLDPTDKENSSKRFVTLIAAFHFIVASFFILYLLGYVVFKEVNGDLEMLKVVGNIFTQILEYDFFIILVGLGFITSEQLIKVLIEKFKAIRNVNSEGWNQWNNWNHDDREEDQSKLPNITKDKNGDLIG